MSTYSYSSPNSPEPGPPPGSSSDERVYVPAEPPASLHYAPRRPFWESRAVRTGALFTVLAVCGVVILAVVRHHIGTEPFLVGMALAVLPVPLLLWAFLWLDRVAPSPWQNVAFAFAWGACAATLVALFANEYGAKLLASTLSATPSQSDRWGATFVAPLVEETAKGTAILLLYLFRRRHIESLLDGIVLGGLVATGFAFTENILYLGTAFGEDKAVGAGVLGSTTAATFFVRVLMTPFAHPLFTSMTGLGFAVAAVARPRSPLRWLGPVGGWLLAMVLHGSWNGSSQLSPVGFLTVYVSVMIPVFGLLVWLAFWARSRELRTVREQLGVYVAAGWLAPREPVALGSMRLRADARDTARRYHGDTGARAVRDYAVYASHLAFLRSAATRGLQPPDFAARESELLHHLWHHRPLAQPALLHALPTPWPPPYPPPFPSPFPTQPAAPAWPPHHSPYAPARQWAPPKHL
ncbi:PrsW family intramembrane metalloprotease [Actinacidiphila epipremni]|uniref:PrsW family intramembrane metalloprotease n=1 Tax=Actinacidiphila epipremni TaxID=2053013 RepID=A0ABX0ZNL0_9ACTN|nr:PrsW family intramembrane metalloprotease [Actinacidiphila epipremni]NJP43228.1 PrsW family intramembrane metalloprotease [Actinacidiphila epipremni]